MNNNRLVDRIALDEADFRIKVWSDLFIDSDKRIETVLEDRLEARQPVAGMNHGVADDIHKAITL